MAVMAMLGVRTLKANRVLKTQAMQDVLTGLANRRFFNETIEREFRRAARSNQSISVIMIDLDHFKDYNDCYGHPAGDECLRAVANTIRGCLRREGEFAARYGGEEIALILPGSDAPRAYTLAARMRLAVRGLGLQHARSVHDIVTFSAGVATCVPGRNSRVAGSGREGRQGTVRGKSQWTRFGEICLHARGSQGCVRGPAQLCRGPH